MSDGMLTLNEVMQYLSLDQAGVEEHIKREDLHAYKIGGVYLRFQKEQVFALRKKIYANEKDKHNRLEHLRNFWEFNNFYIVSGACLVVLLFFVFR